MKRIYLNAIVFPAILVVVGLLNLIINGPNILASIDPDAITVKEVTSGKVFRNIETSFSNNFIQRYKLIEIAGVIEELKGISGNMKIVDTTGINVADDWQKKESSTDEELINGTDFGSILIIDNKAMELNIYNQKAIQLYAETLNRAAENLGENVKVYSLIVPTQIEFSNGEKFNDVSYSQRKSIDELYGKYKNVIGVDVYNVLQNHSNEYIYFRTDHHWTQLGAYYAYTEFIKQFNFDAVELKNFTHFTIKDFLGSLHRVTNSTKLQKHKDVIDVYVPSVKSYMYKSDGKSGEKAKIIDRSYSSEDNKYGVFLSGDYPIIYIESDIDNDLSIAIVKDSYANAFIPFLTNHFRNIYVIDPRLWNGNLYTLVENKDIDYVLFLNYCLINRYEGYSDILKKILY